MDNQQGHPIPQDITGFQFRLIGDMTVKQFAYVAAGSGLAWLSFALPISFLIKAPFIIIFAMLGLILAFLPIQGRSADVMVMLFIRALFHPNQYLYKKNVVKPTQTTTTTPNPQSPTLPQSPVVPEMVTLDSQPNVPPPIQPPEPEKEEKKEEEEQKEEPVDTTKETLIVEEENHLEETLAKAKKDEQLAATGSPQAQEAHEKVVSLEEQLQEVLSQKQEMEKELVSLRQQLEAKKQEVHTPTEAQGVTETSHVKKIPQQLQASVGTPFTMDIPNLISGVVKDPRGNVLPNILVEVKDKDNNPIRAFKTNALGQFLSATPILKGTYTITFDDPKKQQTFDAVEITADGGVIQPIEVTSTDEREELRKQLFAKQ